MLRAEFILYVDDQRRSSRFYAEVLQAQPTLDVPGMTEFALPGGAILGLMPRSSIERLLPQLESAIDREPEARAELYLVVEHCRDWFDRAVAAGAAPLSDPSDRDWGHRVGYVLDPDAHVIAFAQES